MPGFERVYQQIVAAATTTVAQGKAFERLMQTFFCQDPEWKGRFTKVWLWQDWPQREGPDTGIDLVAEQSSGEGYCAIQCKAYAPEHILQKSDIDSFFTASGKEHYSHRLIVSTAKRWSRHAEKALEGQHIKVTRLDFFALEREPFDWPSLTAPEQLRYRGHKKQLRPHQQAAVDAVLAGFAGADRGQLIMACGTGKTFTALNIAERCAGVGAQVLFLVPSIALISQSMREWSRDQSAGIPHRYLAVCSDAYAGQSKREDASLTELVQPPQTNPQKLATALQQPTPQKMTVVFSTYQSLAVVHEAQRAAGQTFDLVICDEAHRTTGVDAAADADSANRFSAIHNNAAIRATKRLYMTATPRLYSADAKKKAQQDALILSSMDDVERYGNEFYRLDFSTAIEQHLLVDYKVLILVVDTNSVAAQMAAFMASDQGLPLGDTARLIGCWNALEKRADAQQNDFSADPQPMRCAVAFANTIQASKIIGSKFKKLVAAYRENQGGARTCTVKHVDGTMGAVERNAALAWLRDGTAITADDSTDTADGCRIISNVRCLSEGVDVPALDAVIFTQPRASQVDVVQSVGRVMRKAPGKHYGYVILPIAVDASADPEATLHNNRAYRVVWEVLQALRAHDNRFNALINTLDLNHTAPPQIQVIGIGGGDSSSGSGGGAMATATKQQWLPFDGIQEWRKALYACIIKKCGNRHYWDDWVDDVIDISQRNIARINAIVHGSDSDHRTLFEEFLGDLRQNLNPHISADDAIEMLSQHAITQPVFDALFEKYRFASENPVSCNMQAMLELLEEQRIARETASLQGFYDSVRQRASGIDNPQGRQRILLELYEKFFAKAFKRDAERLGIVFTPVEIVDFILHSADRLLRQCFGQCLSDEKVHILEPFVGTGTFIARLIQSDLIHTDDLKRKYHHELHANELVLLSYYIAAVNIEESYHQRSHGNYQPFPGIVLSDTFQLSEGEGRQGGKIFDKNPKRAQRQKEAPIRVIIGNPPYSIGQRSQNDANQNLKYPGLDARIEATYAKHSTVTNKNSLYDSYIRALRWATDRIGERGLVAFVTNGAFIDSHSADGLRQCLAAECAHIYIYNLRGNARTSGEQRRKEKDNVFGQGSRLPVTITLLLKDTQQPGPAAIDYHDIGDYLTREEKLAAIAAAGHIGNLEWQRLRPNAHGDWINQRRADFATFLPLGLAANKREGAAPQPSVFRLFCRGVETCRDAWAYNHSRAALADNMARTIAFYNQQLRHTQHLEKDDDRLQCLSRDATHISWSSSLEQYLSRGKTINCDRQVIRPAMYRPFCKQYLYFDRRMNHRVSLHPQLFPTPDSDNLAICVSGAGASKGFSALMVDIVPNLDVLEKSQCFPRYYYAPPPPQTAQKLELAAPPLGTAAPALARQDNIPAATLQAFQSHYADPRISGDALFYYVYGVLHAPDYRERYANDLRKMLPRVPFAADFWAFSDAGRALSALHLDYETLAEYPLTEQRRGSASAAPAIKKMRFGGTPQKPDHSRIVCNDSLTLAGIPLKAYDYQVNGKSAIAWIIDRYQVRRDKASGIANDPNAANPAADWIPRLLKRIVHLSLETMVIVDALPGLD